MLLYHRESSGGLGERKIDGMKNKQSKTYAGLLIKSSQNAIMQNLLLLLLLYTYKCASSRDLLWNSLEYTSMSVSKVCEVEPQGWMFDISILPNGS